MSTTLPQHFGKYILLRKIAMGGMAEIFKGKTLGAEGFEKDIVIKRILPHFTEDESFVKMFIDEASIAAKLQHANIVQIFDFDKHDDRFYIAMEYVEGKDLKRVMEEGVKAGQPLSPPQCAWVAMEVAKALHYAHTKSHKGNPLNIVHRDISPHNVMISFNGEVKLMDFGIAKAASRSTKTMAGTVKGKCAYMSPEQARGKPLDGRSDLFALGVVVWEMLTHKRLFLRDSDFETLTAVLKEEVPRPSQFNPDVSPELDAIVVRALTKDRDERHKDLQDFARDLTRWFYSAVDDLDAVALAPFMKQRFKGDIQKLQAEVAAEKTMFVQDTGAAPSPAPSDGAVDNAGATVAIPAPAVDVQAAKTVLDDPSLTQEQVEEALARARSAAQANPDAATQALALDGFDGAGGDPRAATAMVGGPPNTGTYAQQTGSYTGTFSGRPGGGSKGLVIALAALLLLGGGGAALWFLVLDKSGPKYVEVQSPTASTRGEVAPTGAGGTAAEAGPKAKAPGGKSVLRVKVDPFDAKVTANGKAIDGKLGGLSKGQHVALVARAPGYDELTEEVTITGEDQEVQLKLTKQVQEVSVLIKPVPPTAKVKVDGEELGAGVQAVRGLEGKKIAVEVTPADGGLAIKQDVVLSKAVPLVEIKLPEAVRVAAEVTLAIQPAGAHLKANAGQIVERDGQQVLTGVFVGDKVRIEASRNGFDSWSKEIDVAAAAEALEIKMKKKAEEKGFGTLFINARPWAKVSVDGAPKGTTPVTLRNFPSGRHRVTFTKGSQSQTKSYTIRPGKQTNAIVDFSD